MSNKREKKSVPGKQGDLGFFCCTFFVPAFFVLFIDKPRSAPYNSRIPKIIRMQTKKERREPKK